jgi:hypothetical protein
MHMLACMLLLNKRSMSEAQHRVATTTMAIELERKHGKCEMSMVTSYGRSRAEEKLRGLGTIMLPLITEIKQPFQH